MPSDRIYPLDADALALFESKGAQAWFPAGSVNGLKVRRVMQIIGDFAKLRIFYLACGEGAYAIRSPSRRGSRDGRTQRIEAGERLAGRLGLAKLKVEHVRDVPLRSHLHSVAITLSPNPLSSGRSRHPSHPSQYLRDEQAHCYHRHPYCVGADYRAEHNSRNYQGRRVREHADDDSDKVRRSR